MCGKTATVINIDPDDALSVYATGNIDHYSKACSGCQHEYPGHHGNILVIIGALTASGSPKSTAALTSCTGFRTNGGANSSIEKIAMQRRLILVNNLLLFDLSLEMTDLAVMNYIDLKKMLQKELVWERVKMAAQPEW